MRRSPRTLLLIFAAAAAIAALSLGPARLAVAMTAAVKGWLVPIAPFQIAQGLYYVGSKEVGAYLIVTDDGLILLDGGAEGFARQELANVRALGFDPRRVRILLNSHAHLDHAGALAALKRATGARFYASRADTPLLQSGGRGDFFWDDTMRFPPVRVDQIIDDGAKVSLGGVTLTAHVTAGHTKGCTTWTGAFKTGGVVRQALFLCSVSVLPGYRLVRDPKYPGQAADYEASFRTLRALPCEIFLGSHGGFYGMLAKRAALAAKPASNPFVDPQGCRSFLADSEAAFRTRLAQVSGGKAP